jgi:hypothetical protein
MKQIKLKKWIGLLLVNCIMGVENSSALRNFNDKQSVNNLKNYKENSKDRFDSFLEDLKLNNNKKKFFKKEFNKLFNDSSKHIKELPKEQQENGVVNDCKQFLVFLISVIGKKQYLVNTDNYWSIKFCEKKLNDDPSLTPGNNNIKINLNILYLIKHYLGYVVTNNHIHLEKNQSRYGLNQKSKLESFYAMIQAKIGKIKNLKIMNYDKNLKDTLEKIINNLEIESLKNEDNLKNQIKKKILEYLNNSKEEMEKFIISKNQNISLSEYIIKTCDKFLNFLKSIIQKDILKQNDYRSISDCKEILNTLKTSKRKKDYIELIDYNIVSALLNFFSFITKDNNIKCCSNSKNKENVLDIIYHKLHNQKNYYQKILETNKSQDLRQRTFHNRIENLVKKKEEKFQNKTSIPKTIYTLRSSTIQQKKITPMTDDKNRLATQSINSNVKINDFNSNGEYRWTNGFWEKEGNLYYINELGQPEKVENQISSPITTRSRSAQFKNQNLFHSMADEMMGRGANYQELNDRQENLLEFPGQDFGGYDDVPKTNNVNIGSMIKEKKTTKNIKFSQKNGETQEMMTSRKNQPNPNNPSMGEGNRVMGSMMAGEIKRIKKSHDKQNEGYENVDTLEMMCDENIDDLSDEYPTLRQRSTISGGKIYNPQRNLGYQQPNLNNISMGGIMGTKFNDRQQNSLEFHGQDFGGYDDAPKTNNLNIGSMIKEKKQKKNINFNPNNRPMNEMMTSRRKNQSNPNNPSMGEGNPVIGSMMTSNQLNPNNIIYNHHQGQGMMGGKQKPTNSSNFRTMAPQYSSQQHTFVDQNIPTIDDTNYEIPEFRYPQKHDYDYNYQQDTSNISGMNRIKSNQPLSYQQQNPEYQQLAMTRAPFNYQQQNPGYQQLEMTRAPFNYQQQNPGSENINTLEMMHSKNLRINQTYIPQQMVTRSHQQQNRGNIGIMGQQEKDTQPILSLQWESIEDLLKKTFETIAHENSSRRGVTRLFSQREYQELNGNQQRNLERQTNEGRMTTRQQANNGRNLQQQTNEGRMTTRQQTNNAARNSEQQANNPGNPEQQVNQGRMATRQQSNNGRNSQQQANGNLIAIRQQTINNLKTKILNEEEKLKNTPYRMSDLDLDTLINKIIKKIDKRKKFKVNSVDPDLNLIYNGYYNFIQKYFLDKIADDSETAVSNKFHQIIELNKPSNLEQSKQIYGDHNELTDTVLMKLLRIINNFIKEILIKTNDVDQLDPNTLNDFFGDFDSIEEIEEVIESSINGSRSLKEKFIEWYLHIESEKINSR